MTDNPELPPFLRQTARDRAREAINRAVPSTAATSPVASSAPVAPTAPAASPPPAPRKRTRKPQISTAASTTAASNPTERGGNRSAPLASDLTGAAGNLEALADRIVAESADQVGAALLRPHLPVILDALVRGASMPGSQGAADRSMLLRLVRHSSSTAREQQAAARGLAAAVGAGVEAAMARREAARRRVIEGRSEPVGRVGVTPAARIALDA